MRSTFRNSVMGERKEKNGKGWRGSFRDRLDVPKDEATPILLLRGKYEDPRGKQQGELAYYPHTVHSLKLAASGPGSFREIPCSGHECVGCYAKDGGDPRVTTRDKFALNVLHLSIYRKEPIKDKDGKVLTYSEDGKDHRRGDAVMGWNEVTGRKDRKDIAANPAAAVASGDVSLFRRKYLDLGRNHLEALMAIDELASKLCFCGGSLAPTAFHCESCDELLCDVENSNMTAKQVNEYSGSRQRCSSCGHLGFTKIITICDSCEEPSPMSVFDVVAYVRKHGENTASTIMVEKIVPLTEFTLADGNALVKDWDVGAEGVTPVWADNVAGSMTQFDFEQVFAASDSQYVSSLLGINNPFGGPAPQQTRSYGAQNSGPTGGAKRFGR
jgi:hypothetical protein